MSRRGWVVAGAILASGVLGLGYVAAADRVSVEVVAGFAVTPRGPLVQGEDGVEMRWSDGKPARFRVRVPVRNTSRRAVEITYPYDMAAGGAHDAPRQTVRVAPGEVVWLEMSHADHGCDAAQPPGTRIGFRGVAVEVGRPGQPAEETLLPFPVEVSVPAVDVAACLSGGRP